MEIKLNNLSKDIPEVYTVEQLVDLFMPERKLGIAIAINNTVISKKNWNTVELHPNDDVLIINATQGG